MSYQGRRGASIILRIDHCWNPAPVIGLLAFLYITFGWAFAANSLNDTTSSKPLENSSEIHTVTIGENLWTIAGKYTSPYDWLKIYEANRKNISYADMIFPGQTLIIPESMLADKEEETNSHIEEEQFVEASESPTETVNAVEEPVSRRVIDPGLQIDGLVIDETMTKVGRDFYDVFYSQWQSPAKAFNYTVTVSETPMPNFNTRITIKVNEADVFQAYLQPRYEMIEGAAQQGVGRTQWFLQNHQSAPIAY